MWPSQDGYPWSTTHVAFPSWADRSPTIRLQPTPSGAARTLERDEATG
jgi:hypothetical protein